MAVKPRIKLDKKEAKKGDLVEVKALVSHVMETGQRKDASGNTVPMTVTVDSPMTEQSHVTEVLIVADANPRSGVATFHFTPASGVAEANTRIRLASTQDVIAVVKMNDGSFYTASKQVKVTIGGCGG